MNTPELQDQKVPPRVEEFLKAVEVKTSNDIHGRLLRACRSDDPTTSMEAELKMIMEQIINEA
jgi:hypothetical protein